MSRSTPPFISGTWNGTYSSGEKFSFSISKVQGFRAKVKFQSGNGPIQFQDVLIKNSSFRIGDTKFLLTKKGHAQYRDGRHESRDRRLVLNKATATLA